MNKVIWKRSQRLKDGVRISTRTDDGIVRHCTIRNLHGGKLYVLRMCDNHGKHVISAEGTLAAMLNIADSYAIRSWPSLLYA